MTEIKQFEQKVGTLRLSEAIRIGARMRPKGVGCPFSANTSCALGAAAEALGMEYNRACRTLDARRYIEERLANSVKPSIWDRIVRLNDDANMSRESIADWLSSIGL